MKHESIKEMVFYFLKRINYNQSWEKIELEIGYDFCNFIFGGKKDIVEKVTRLAKQNWIELHGYFDKEGN